MYNNTPPNNIPLLFTNDESLPKSSKKMALSHYFMQALVSRPNLVGADVSAYRDYVQRYVPRLLSYEAEQIADLPKCNVRAAKARQDGNVIYQKKEDGGYYLLKALTKYNESICWARSDSEDLGIGYANRSAVYYGIKEYELALANIALAKKHNYPERLMPKLHVRELNCKSRIAADEQRNSVLRSKLALNVEVNPKIPFVAKGITMKELPRFGRSMVAETDFKVGNVILCEEHLMAVIEPTEKYAYCHFCSSRNCVSLIPCPHCVSVMYCSEECLEKSWKYTHRFECGICDKIGSMPFDESYMAPKMFFYALTLFNDNVSDMMEYCRSHTRTGSNPFDLDYTKEDRLAEFKVFHTAKVQPIQPTRAVKDVVSLVSAIWYSIYIQHPLVRSLFVSKAEQDFMLQCICGYADVFMRLVVARHSDKVRLLHTIASVCNHSCKPNAHAMFRNSGQMTIVVIRPIHKGEQICISYGCEDESHIERRKLLSALDIDCACELCDPNSTKKRSTKSQSPPPNFFNDLATMQMVLDNATFSKADKINSIQQFLQRYAYGDGVDRLRDVLAFYRDTLHGIFTDEMVVKTRKKILASLK